MDGIKPIYGASRRSATSVFAPAVNALFGGWESIESRVAQTYMSGDEYGRHATTNMEKLFILTKT